MEPIGLDTVFLWVDDLDRSTAFYRDVVGIRPGPRHGAWQIMDLGDEGITFALHGSDEPVTPSGSVVVGFRVADLDAATAALEAAGCAPIDPEPTEAGLKAFMTFTDPDGHAFQLIEHR